LTDAALAELALGLSKTIGSQNFERIEIILWSSKFLGNGVVMAKLTWSDQKSVDKQTCQNQAQFPGSLRSKVAHNLASPCRVKYRAIELTCAWMEAVLSEVICLSKLPDATPHKAVGAKASRSSYSVKLPDP
jgi:hypothetical protein